MPGSQHGPSIKNPRVYDALCRKGMSKERAARISNAMVGKASGTAPLAIPPSGPHALFNQPGVGIRSARRRRRLKGWDAKVGQVIAGNLVRGEGGRFSGSGQPSARATNSEAQRKRAAERRAARQARAEERAAAREAETAQEEATRAEEDSYIAAGATGRERQRRRAEIAAKRRQRAAARREARRREADTERAARQQEDESEAKTRAEEQAAADAKKGGGGGGKAKPTDDEKRAEQDKKKAANRAKTAPQAGLSAEEAEALKLAAEGGQVSEAQVDNLAELGLIAAAGNNQFEATDAGRRALAALERGDVRGALAAIQDGKAKVARDQARAEAQRKRDEEKRQRDARKVPDAGRREPGKKKPAPNRGPLPPRQLPPKTQPKVDAAAERARSQDLARRVIRNLEERRRRRSSRGIGGITNVERRNADSRRGIATKVKEKAARGMPLDTPILANRMSENRSDPGDSLLHTRAAGALPQSYDTTSFAVFKDASGVDRWAAITTTAYQDKDQEWISCKAIQGVVAAGDAGAPRGPLRFWHVPGLDLGDCDYQAALGDGRLLLESGTFRSKAAARIGAEAARRGYQMSPGFVHTRQEPRGGVFDHIALFERSFVPPGRASNPYTRLLTKETRMLTDEKRKEFETLAGDSEGRALLQSLLAQAETTTKAADAAGAVYKDAPPWAQDLARRLGALETTVKAPMPAEEMVEAGATEMADGVEELAEEPMDEAAGDLLDDEGFADLIVSKLLAQLGPLLELEKKMAGWAGEIKAGLPQMQQQFAQKDDARAQEIADLRERLKALEGDQPRRHSLTAGVWGDLTGTGIPVTKEQAAVLAVQQPQQQAPAGLNGAEADAYRLIFGNE